MLNAIAILNLNNIIAAQIAASVAAIQRAWRTSNWEVT
jgi:hypothetical protein